MSRFGNIAQVNHTTFRKSVRTRLKCANCNSTRKSRLSLFQYGELKDRDYGEEITNNDVKWDKDLFCSKECRESKVNQ